MFSINFARQSIQTAAATFAVGRLVYIRLIHRFPVLFCFLIFFALSAGLFAIVPDDTPLYYWMYIGYTPLQNILIIIAVRELFALVFEDYPGIQTIGRWAMYAGIAIFITASLAVAWIFWHGGAGSRDRRLFYLEVVQRSVLFSIAGVIATILFVLSRYPLRPEKNTLYSILFFSFFFLSDAARLLIDSLAPGLYNSYVDGTESVIISALFTGWAVLLGREPSPRISRIHFSVSGEKRLMAQLDALNGFLGRAGRR